ncbi:MAG: TSUP family transporter [Candidatus Melainabacteria bacterium]|nr:TSUP family transporter [Candidatus Melainabacteria bacterium]
MTFVLTIAAAFLASILTFFTGFGLGTVLLAVFVLVFPVNFAIAATAVVHLSNNVFKLFLVGKHARKDILVRFGIAALLAALAGAYILTVIDSSQVVLTYQFMGKQLKTTPVRCVIGFLMAAFALMDLFGLSEKWVIDPGWMPVGGVLSGFFGGLSGNQGAFRTMFLLKAGLTKEELIGTGAAIGCLVDLGRLTIYWSQINGPELRLQLALLTAATFSAIAGTLVGNKLLEKVSLKKIEIAASVLFLAIAFGLGTGLF